MNVAAYRTRWLWFLIVLATITCGCVGERKGVAVPRASEPPPQAPAEIPPPPVPAPTPLPQAPAEIPPPPEPLLLSPDIPDIEKNQMKQETMAKLKSTKDLVAKIDPKQLTEQDRTTLSTIQTFLSNAQAAVLMKDYARALNLAGKAHTLAVDLTTAKH